MIIECNPRTTDGALLMESDELAGEPARPGAGARDGPARAR